MIIPGMDGSGDAKRDDGWSPEVSPHTRTRRPAQAREDVAGDVAVSADLRAETVLASPAHRLQRARQQASSVSAKVRAASTEQRHQIRR